MDMQTSDMFISGIDEEKRDAIWAIDVAQIPKHIRMEDALEEWKKGNIPNSAVKKIYPSEINK